jgi:hypothetical protein
MTTQKPLKDAISQHASVLVPKELRRCPEE